MSDPTEKEADHDTDGRGADDSQPEPTKTDHPTGDRQATENIEREPAG